MAECEICGKKATKRAEIEGVVMNVCDECVKFGKEIVARNVIIKTSQRQKPLSVPEISLDLPKIVREYREKRQMSQAQLAAAILEKASVIKKIEEGWIPPTDVVKKLEKLIGTKLLEE
jgi:putative transcription factor